VDVAFGGNFYAIVDSQEHFRDLADFKVADLVRLSPLLRDRINRLHAFVHPQNDTIRGVTHIQWTGASQTAGAHSRNAVFYGEKAIDRSPCGTGTSARMAQWAARGQLKPGDVFVHESIIGSTFKGRFEAWTDVAGMPAIVPSIEGWARVTGLNTIFIDERDPYAHGFQVT
jgi:4-hydroxyproline epimerase